MQCPFDASNEESSLRQHTCILAETHDRCIHYVIACNVCLNSFQRGDGRRIAYIMMCSPGSLVLERTGPITTGKKFLETTIIQPLAVKLS